MNIDKIDNSEFLTYGFIVRANKDAIVNVNHFLLNLENCKIIFQKSSKLKMYIREEVY